MSVSAQEFCLRPGLPPGRAENHDLQKVTRIRRACHDRILSERFLNPREICLNIKNNRAEYTVCTPSPARVGRRSNCKEIDSCWTTVRRTIHYIRSSSSSCKNNVSNCFQSIDLGVQNIRFRREMHAVYFLSSLPSFHVSFRAESRGFVYMFHATTSLWEEIIPGK
jgi:hypothetical protein